jgi:hypothetical protein
MILRHWGADFRMHVPISFVWKWLFSNSGP